MANITNNYYVYLYLDPRKPGNYVYKDLKLDYEPFYVGKGKRDRHLSHLNENNLKPNNPKNKKIKKIIEFKLKPIIIKFLTNISEEEAISNEIKLISLIGRKDLKNGPLTNLTNGGDGLSGHIFSETHREKLTNRKLGKKLTESHKQNISNSIKGEKNPLYGKISHLKDKPRSIVTKMKISEKMSGDLHHMFGKPSKNRRKVNQIDRGGNLIKTWDSIAEASKHFNLSATSIIDVCKNKYKTAGGYNWQYNN